MDRDWKAGAAVAAPAYPSSPSNGFPTDGDPSGGVEATVPGAWWFHMITEELRHAIVQTGLTPDGADLTQLWQAIVGPGQSLASPGYQKLPGGLIFQWATLTGVDNPTAITFPNGALAVAVSNRAVSDGINNMHVVAYDSLSPTGFTFRAVQHDGYTAVSTGVSYFAVGY